ncbi:hypothetical protein HOY82DRAFT_269215 [Tuber indicum]|nr:hypothetical protein HOY82DRAFT_269215 [Tuber indicum]
MSFLGLTFASMIFCGTRPGNFELLSHSFWPSTPKPKPTSPPPRSTITNKPRRLNCAPQSPRGKKSVKRKGGGKGIRKFLSRPSTHPSTLSYRYDFSNITFPPFVPGVPSSGSRPLITGCLVIAFLSVAVL